MANTSPLNTHTAKKKKINKHYHTFEALVLKITNPADSLVRRS